MKFGNTALTFLGLALGFVDASKNCSKYAHPEWECANLLECNHHPDWPSNSGDRGNGIITRKKELWSSSEAQLVDFEGLKVRFNTVRLSEANDLATREENCCRPTMECYDMALYWQSRGYEIRGQMEQLPLVGWEQMMCCWIAFWHKHPSCPRPPRISLTDTVVWHRPPKCAEVTEVGEFDGGYEVPNP